MASKLYTIGYAGFPDVNAFVQTLKDYGVQILIDVRSSPYSSYFEAYNKDRLGAMLKDNGIYYYNYARQFGARQENREFYNFDKQGRFLRLDFKTFSESEQFLDGVRKVEKSDAVIALMCAEKRPSECHRTILVARAFSDRGHEVFHILPNGETVTQKDVEKELVDHYFPDREQGSFFNEDNLTEEEYVEEAYRLRNDEIGFKLGDLLQ